MSDDLEDFLRRAAARRRTKEAASSSSRPSRQAPEYSDRNRERVVALDELAEQAEVVEVVENPRESLADERRRIDAAKLRATEITNKARKSRSSIRSKRTPLTTRVAVTSELTNPTNVAELLQLLKAPGGARTAILLKEILDRPEHRW